MGSLPPVIVRFVQFMDKLSVLKAREQLKRVDVGVSNDLTVSQRNELAKLRENGQRGYYKNGSLHVDPPAKDGAQHAHAHAQMGAGATQRGDRYYARASRRGGRGGRGGM